MTEGKLRVVRFMASDAELSVIAQLSKALSGSAPGGRPDAFEVALGNFVLSALLAEGASRGLVAAAETPLAKAKRLLADGDLDGASAALKLAAAAKKAQAKP